MTIKDYKKVHKLWKKTKGIGLGSSDSKKDISNFLKKNPGLSFVCEIDGNIAGAVLGSHDGRRGFIRHLAVDEKYRKMGIGKKLVSLCLKKLKSKGIYGCHLFVLKNNKIGINFWTKTGWSKLDHIFVFSKKI